MREALADRLDLTGVRDRRRAVDADPPRADAVGIAGAQQLVEGGLLAGDDDRMWPVERRQREAPVDPCDPLLELLGAEVDERHPVLAAELVQRAARQRGDAGSVIERQDPRHAGGRDLA